MLIFCQQKLSKTFHTWRINGKAKGLYIKVNVCTCNYFLTFKISWHHYWIDVPFGLFFIKKLLPWMLKSVFDKSCHSFTRSWCFLITVVISFLHDKIKPLLKLKDYFWHFQLALRYRVWETLFMNLRYLFVCLVPD